MSFVTIKEMSIASNNLPVSVRIEQIADVIHANAKLTI